MRPISIAFQCFGPYLQRQFIDFATVGMDGMFLICGETGSGKTTILDAISCALYGMATDNKRGRMVNLRTEFAPPDQKTEVEFFFEHNGQNYRFYRSILPKRKPVDLEKEKEDLEEANRPSMYGTVTEKFHVVFDCERQGEDGHWVAIWEGAKKGMSATAAQKVIGLSYKQFSQIVILPQGKFETFIMSPTGQKEDILKSLFHTQRWEDAVTKIETAAKEEERALDKDISFFQGCLKAHSCQTVEQLRKKVDEAEAKNAEIKEKLATARNLYNAKNRELTNAQRLLYEFEELEKTKNELDPLLAQWEEMEKEGRILEKAEKADLLRDEYAAYEEGKKEHTMAEMMYTETEQELAEIKRQIEDEDDKISAVRMLIREKYKKIEAENPREKQTLGDMIDEYSSLCDQMIQEKIESVQRKLNLTIERKPNAYADEEELGEKAGELLEKIGELSSEIMGYAIQEGIHTEEKGAWEQTKVSTENKYMLLEYRKKQADKKWEPIRIHWETVRKENGFNSDEEFYAFSLPVEEKTARIRSLAQYHDRVQKGRNTYENKLRKLDGKEKPNLPELDEIVQALQKETVALEVAYEGIQRALQDRETLGELQDLQEKMRDRQEKLEKRLTFIKMLKGSTGVGIQRYILGVMFSTVIQEANELLQNVLEGRYTIHRTDEGTGKKGLELAVCSYGEGEGRLVKTLSGGEKFLISLCLAIGLSTVVQVQGGGRVEAMFIDEGFGTLDKERIDDALNILQMSRKRTDMIGLISHVDYLAELTHAKLRIHKTRSGSSITMEV